MLLSVCLDCGFQIFIRLELLLHNKINTDFFATVVILIINCMDQFKLIASDSVFAAKRQGHQFPSELSRIHSHSSLSLTLLLSLPFRPFPLPPVRGMDMGGLGAKPPKP